MGQEKTMVDQPRPSTEPTDIGVWAVLFILSSSSCSGVDMTTLLMDFGADVDDNNKMVYDFVQDRYDLNHLTMVDTENVLSQFAQARLSVPSIRKTVWTA